jgi:membrane associated rhomboid family serine protease
MIESRDYMREPEYRPNANRWRSATGILLIVNVVVFIGQVLMARFAKDVPVDDYLGLSIAGLVKGYVWQFLTFQFLHGSVLHLLLNSLGLFTFGYAVEQFLGVKRFWQLYLISGVIGGFVHCLGGLIWPTHFGVAVDVFHRLHYTPMVGASAGLFGLIAAFALMFPERDLTILLFFVFPVTVSAKVLLGVSAGVSILGVLIDKGNVAHGAHAGGMLGGWLMLRFFARRPIYETPNADEKRISPTKAARMETEFLNKEVDTILDKISKKGIHSLTDAERNTLETARKKLEKR